MPLAALTSFALVVQLAQPSPVRGRVLDAGTDAPVPMATVRWSRSTTITDARGGFAIAASVGDTMRVQRVGYRPHVHVIADAGPIVVRLVPAATPLAVVRVRDSAATARLVAAVSADELRARGAATLAEGMRTMPFVAARGARGQAVLSMRGARPEQVLVTFDGVPLNDPASGVADLADIPLAAVAAATATPGADAARFGSGASGGVLSLTSADGSAASLTVGSFGRRVSEAAGSLRVGGGTVRGGGAWATARNDFPFVNREGATGSDSVERRVNADESRASLFASAVFPRVQLLLLASGAERGMVGPMNVRAYDEDRGTTRRGIVRLAAPLGRVALDASVRAFATGYRDPRAPVNDFEASSTSADVELAGAAGVVGLRAGAGGDRTRTIAIGEQSRGRAFAAAAHSGTVRGVIVRSSARVDAVSGAGVQLSPSLALERPTGQGALFARVSQAFRAPTLYDVYFAGAQRLVARALRPERVTLDAELGARVALGPVRAAASLFERRTRDAIVWFPGNFGWSASNVGRDRVRGAEGRLDAEFAHGSLAGWGAVYDAELTADALRIPTPYVPRASGGAVATLRAGRGTLTTTLQSTGRRAFGSGPASRDYELPAVGLLGVTASYRAPLFGARALLSVGVDNATDAEWQSVRFHPTPGRTWSAGLTLTP
jgi:outer membrane cobalamin receptor